MPTANVGEIELDYERSGEGPPLLLVMGMSGTREHWGEPFLRALRSHFAVIAYDHRGVGGSRRMSGSFTIADLAADAIGLLDALAIERAHVLGISMGGMVAQEIALARPELPVSLTLGCTYCGGEGSMLAGEDVLSVLGQALASRDRERAVRASWEVNVSSEFAADEEAWARFRETSMRRAVALSVLIEQMKAISEHDTSARLEEIVAPTLLIHGDADRMLPVTNAHAIARRMPGARLELFAGVGHLFFWERAERSAELVREHAAVHAA
jgi:pimeloyl-ACP methyl ester carboxylesterase